MKSTEYAFNLAKEIQGPMTDVELIWLGDQVKDGDLILELGSLFGKTTKMFTNSAEFVFVLSIDDGRGEPHNNTMIGNRLFNEWNKNLAEEVAYGHAKLLQITTGEFNTLFSWLPDGDFFEFDIVWIDASHDYNSVLHDCITAKNFVKDGGIICGHDYHWGDVRRAVQDVFDPSNVITMQPNVSIKSQNKIWLVRT